jgi:hypothetical protein
MEQQNNSTDYFTTIEKTPSGSFVGRVRKNGKQVASVSAGSANDARRRIKQLLNHIEN